MATKQHWKVITINQIVDILRSIQSDALDLGDSAKHDARKIDEGIANQINIEVLKAIDLVGKLDDTMLDLPSTKHLQHFDLKQQELDEIQQRNTADTHLP